MKPVQLFDPASSSYTYVLFDEATREALIIDPVDEQIERDLAVLREHGLKLLWTVETHAHADHITSASQLAELAGARTAAPSGCSIHTAAVQLKHGDVLRFWAGAGYRPAHPGHTAGSMSYLWRDHVFTGDTLLINGCGRTDFQSGSPEALYYSLTQVLFAPARCHHGLARPRLPGPHPHHHRQRETEQPAHCRQVAGRVPRHHGRLGPAGAQTHRRGGGRQPEFWAAA